jgi:hypothetical protein
MFHRPGLSRHIFLKSCPAVITAPSLLAGPRLTDIQVEQVSHSYKDYKYGAPYMFGGSLVDRMTLLNVDCTVRTRDGRRAKGFGSIPTGVE